VRAIACGSVTILLLTGAFGQQTDPRPAFEVASVKPAAPPTQGPPVTMLQGGPGTRDPDRITRTGVTLQMLIREAYGINSYDQIQGPGWLSEARFDVLAKLPPGSTKEQFELMLQALLEERFHLALHRVMKDFPIYELTIAKGGSKLKENTETLESTRPGDPRLPSDRDGYPQIPPGKSGLASTRVNGLVRMTVRGMPLTAFTSSQLGAQLGAITGSGTYAPGRIVDKTGLTGKYDFKLEYAGDNGIGGALSLPAAGADAEPTGGLPLIDAMEKQLGLKLTKTTAPYDVLVIDHAERVPTEN